MIYFPPELQITMVSPILVFMPMIGLVLASPTPVRHPVAALFQRLNSDYNLAVASSDDDLVSLIQGQTDGLVAVLNRFADDEKAVEFVEKNSQSSSCIRSFDDAISATEAASKIMKDSAPDLETFLTTFETIKDEKDILVLMRGSATMLRQMDVLIPKLAKFPLSTQCRISPSKHLEGLQELAALISKLSSTNTIDFPVDVKGYLERSAKIMKATANFMEKFIETFKKFNKFCSTDSEYSAAAVTAVGDMFENTAQYLNDLGSDFDLTDIKNKNIKFTTGLVDTIKELSEQDLPFLTCSTSGNYKKTAEDLEDIADVVEEIGLEDLSDQLGVKFDLSF